MSDDIAFQNSAVQVREGPWTIVSCVHDEKVASVSEFTCSLNTGLMLVLCSDCAARLEAGDTTNDYRIMPARNMTMKRHVTFTDEAWCAVCGDHSIVEFVITSGGVVNHARCQHCGSMDISAHVLKIRQVLDTLKKQMAAAVLKELDYLFGSAPVGDASNVLEDGN
jgi:hypothetical protein